MEKIFDLARSDLFPYQIVSQSQICIARLRMIMEDEYSMWWYLLNPPGVTRERQV